MPSKPQWVTVEDLNLLNYSYVSKISTSSTFRRQRYKRTSRPAAQDDTRGLQDDPPHFRATTTTMPILTLIPAASSGPARPYSSRKLASSTTLLGRCPKISSKENRWAALAGAARVSGTGHTSSAQTDSICGCARSVSPSLRTHLRSTLRWRLTVSNMRVYSVSTFSCGTSGAAGILPRFATSASCHCR